MEEHFTVCFLLSLWRKQLLLKKITYFTSLIMHFIWAKLMLLVTVLQHLIKEIPSSQPPLSKDGAPLRVSRFEEIPEATKKKTKKK